MGASDARRSELTESIKQWAAELGFRRAAVCPAAEPDRLAEFHAWLDAGYAGEMRYLADRRDAYAHPRHVLEGAQSLVMLLMDYRSVAPKALSPGDGRISKYAWGSEDYHDLVHPRLKQLVKQIQAAAPDARGRGVIDTAPLLERDFAQAAGLGWIGKNTLLLTKDGGSLFFLAALLLDVPLRYDQPWESDHCGTCTACLDACPTDAFPQPYILDATRCISYLTIELRDAIPAALRPGMGDWVFGCDVCQDVCPWNRHAPVTREPQLTAKPGRNPLPLIPMFYWTDDQFRAEFRHSPLWRSRRRGILRNAAIVLGNQRCHEAAEALIHGLRDDEPLIRGACAWSLGQLATPAAAAALRDAAVKEADADVLKELQDALPEH